jgi:hypothetical protein
MWFVRQDRKGVDVNLAWHLLHYHVENQMDVLACYYKGLWSQKSQRLHIICLNEAQRVTRFMNFGVHVPNSQAKTSISYLVIMNRMAIASICSEYEKHHGTSYQLNWETRVYVHTMIAHITMSLKLITSQSRIFLHANGRTSRFWAIYCNR